MREEMAEGLSSCCYWMGESVGAEKHAASAKLEECERFARSQSSVAGADADEVAAAGDEATQVDQKPGRMQMMLNAEERGERVVVVVDAEVAAAVAVEAGAGSAGLDVHLGYGVEAGSMRLLHQQTAFPVGPPRQEVDSL